MRFSVRTSRGSGSRDTPWQDGLGNACELGILMPGELEVGSEPAANWVRLGTCIGSAQMLQRLALPCATAIAMVSSLGFAQSPSPNGVKTLDPPGAIKAEGTWSLGARAGDLVFVAGMQGIDPATNTLVPDPQARIRQAFPHIRPIGQSAGIPQYQADCAIGRRQPAGLRADHGLRQRPASLRAHGR